MTMRKGLPAKLALTDADDTRYVFSGLVVCNIDGTPRGGVLSPAGQNLVTSTGTMNVSVKRFQGAAVRDSGVVLLANDGPTNVLLDAAPASNKRLDVVYAKQNDASGTVTVPDGDNLPVFGVAKGTAGAVPVKPAIPDGALELAMVEIPSTATATNSAGVVITQTAQFTVGSGGLVPFLTKPAMDAVTTLPNGTHGVVLAGLVEYVFNGSVWVAQGLADSGWITPTLVAGWATPAGNFVPLQYRKIGNEVIFRGAATGATSGDPIFTLPTGYRPAIASGKELYFVVLNGTSTSAITRVVIRDNGTVVAVSSTTPNFGQISFRTD